MNRNSVILLILVFGFILGTVPSLYTHPARSTQVRRCCDGEVWLSMTRPQRHAFVAGFISGVQHGHRDGCTTYDEIARPEFKVKSPEEIPLSKCMQSELRFEKPLEHYEDRITRFYENYAKDRDIPFFVLFSSISDGQDQPDEKIHEWMAH